MKTENTAALYSKDFRNISMGHGRSQIVYCSEPAFLDFLEACVSANGRIVSIVDYLERLITEIKGTKPVPDYIPPSEVPND